MTSLRLETRQVVLLAFPFSDLSAQKLRPALVLAEAGREDFVLCQITSRPYGDMHAVPLRASDFTDGGLQVDSFARPAKLFTGHVGLIQGVAGQLDGPAHQRVCDALIHLLRAACLS